MASRGFQARLGERLEVRFQVVEVRALHAALGAGEAQLHDLVRKADDLEELRAAIARDGGDAHLRHDLEQPLAQPRAVAAPELEPRREVELDASGAHHLEQHLVGHVRVHRGRAVADQAGEMVRLARGAGLDQQVALAAQPALHQVLVHRAGHEQRVRGDAALHQVAIRQQQHQLALAHRALRLRAHAPDRALQAFGRVVLQVDELVRDLLDRENLPQLALREDRRAEHHLRGVLGRGREDVAFRPDLRLQRHHDRLAQRIDRRVGDLGELLAEVVVERAHLVRQHRERRVIAHRAHRLVLVLREHADDVVTLLLGDVEHLLIEARAWRDPWARPRAAHPPGRSRDNARPSSASSCRDGAS